MFHAMETKTKIQYELELIHIEFLIPVPKVLVWNSFFFFETCGLFIYIH